MEQQCGSTHLLKEINGIDAFTSSELNRNTENKVRKEQNLPESYTTVKINMSSIGNFKVPGGGTSRLCRHA
jgi:hypothetical protein